SSVLGLPGVVVDEAAHACDHALEVQLPFLQVLLPDFTIAPFLVGRASEDSVAEVLARLWRPQDSLIVVSSDLSHHLPPDEARALDARTAAAIVALDGAAVGPEQACGQHAIRGLLCFARQQGWYAAQVALSNSGETAGPRDEVVGYGAFVFTDPSAV